MTNSRSALLPCNPEHYPYSKVAVDAGIRPQDIFGSEGVEGKRKQNEPMILPPSTPEQIAAKRSYRITPETLESLREILKAFQGTKNHHNFTVGKSFMDKSSNRYIMSFAVFYY